MDYKINHKLAFIQNRCTICVYERFSNSLRNIDDFSWRNVSKIICFRNDSNVCSICFQKILLPRMDRCGHIFCLSCILSVFDVKQCNHSPCPFCKDVEIDINSLKRVEFHEQNLLKIGDLVKLSLLVKGNENICPRFAHMLSNFRDDHLPKLDNGISKYLSIVSEKDYQCRKDILDDMKVVKVKLGKRKCRRIESEKLLQHLSKELIHFDEEIKLVNEGVRAEEDEGLQEDRFNLIEWERSSERFQLFYQAEGYRLVFLDDSDRKQIFYQAQQFENLIEHDTVQEIETKNRWQTGTQETQQVRQQIGSKKGQRAKIKGHQRGTKIDEKIELQSGLKIERKKEQQIEKTQKRKQLNRLPPIQIIAKIKEIRNEIVDNQFLLRTKLTHLFLGVTVTIVKVDLQLKNEATEISNGHLRLLQSHQELIYKALKEEQEMREKIAKRAVERRSLPPPKRILTTATMSNTINNTDNVEGIRPKLFEAIVEGFNTCTLGIDCLVPDEDYPHAETCVHYTRAKPLPSVSPRTSSADEKFLGILRMKLNVFHPDEEAPPIDRPADKADVGLLIDIPLQTNQKVFLNPPPERLPFDDMLDVNINNMAPYIIPRKPKSQNQQKKLRKLQKQSVKMICA